MRIALITTLSTKVQSGSGTAVFFNSLMGGLRQRGYDPQVIAPEFDTANYVQSTLQRFLFNTELRTDPIVKSADLVIGFDYDGYGLDPATRPPMFTSAHAVYGDVIRWESEPYRTMVEAQAFFDRIAMERADHVTIGSQYAKQRVIDLYGIVPEKISVIPHGMMPHRWLPLVNAEKRTENDHPIVLAVGKLYPRKRINVLLQSIALLRESYPSVELRIAGDGIEWDRLHKVADDLKLGANVRWLSHVADDAQFAREWRQADIFCHPSCQESFGYVYLEAMTLGKAIVAVRAGAAPEVLDGAALLAEPENPESLAAALDQLLRDRDLRERYGQLARERARLYTLDRTVDGYSAIIERLSRK